MFGADRPVHAVLLALLLGCGTGQRLQSAPADARSTVPRPARIPNAPRVSPPATVPVAASSVGETEASPLPARLIGSEQMRAAVVAQQRGIEECYGTAVRDAGELPRMRLDVELTITESGAVTDVVARGPALGSLHDCVERTITGWQLPPPEEAIRAVLPFIFPGAGTDAVVGLVPLEVADIRTVVQANREHVQQCYIVAARRAGDSPELRIDVTITIASSGAVTEVDIQGPALASLHDCVEAAMRSWRFPLAGEATRVGVPFIFRPMPAPPAGE